MLNVGVSHLSFAPVLFGGPGSAATSSLLTAVSRVAALSGLALAAPVASTASTASTEGAALSPRGVVILVVVLFLDDRESFVVGPVFPEAATIAAATAVASAFEAVASLALLVAKKASLSLFLLCLRGASRSFLFLSRNALLLLLLLVALSRLRDVDGRWLPLLAQKGLALGAGEG